jgi:predicted RNase H-like HicB family nuclease
MTPHYHINLFWSDEDDSWIADVPDLRFCSADGPTPDDALREIKIAMDLWLTVAREHGDAIPEALYRPALAKAA